jgi:transposase
MTTLYPLGLDVAKRTFDAALLLNHGRGCHRQFANTPAGFDQLAVWLRQHATDPVHAGLEATGTYGEALAMFLHEHGTRVSVINPARIHAFARSELARNKTDALDAALIARFIATQHPPAWTPPPLAQRQLQALVRRRHALQAMRQQEQNRADLEAPTGILADSLRTHLVHLDQQLVQLQQQLRDHVRAHPELARDQQLLETIPGIGETTALLLLVELSGRDQWHSARQAAAYAGLNPAQRESGSSVRGRSHLSKIGNARLRRGLYLPAVAAMRFNPLLKRFAARLRERGKPPMVIVGAVMRKLLHQAYGVLKHQRPFDSNYAPAC